MVLLQCPHERIDFFEFHFVRQRGECRNFYYGRPGKRNPILLRQSENGRRRVQPATSAFQTPFSDSAGTHVCRVDQYGPFGRLYRACHVWAGQRKDEVFYEKHRYAYLPAESSGG